MPKYLLWGMTFANDLSLSPFGVIMAQLLLSLAFLIATIMVLSVLFADYIRNRALQGKVPDGQN